jgi:purine-binding chemotaxis protein CheW
VIDLAEQFGLPSRQGLTEDAKIVVAEIAGQTVGMLVDEVPGVLSIQRGDIEPAPEVIQTQVKKDYIKGIGKVGERLFIILNLEKILTSHEVEELVEAGV